MRTTTFEPLFAATATADQATDNGRADRTAPAKSAVWTKIYSRLIEARQAQASAIVARHMAHQDDATLKAVGWSAAEIADLRRRHGVTAR